MLDKRSLPYTQHVEWATNLRSVADPDAKVPLALEFLADASGSDAAGLYDELKQLDSMRSNYWEWKRSLLVKV